MKIPAASHVCLTVGGIGLAAALCLCPRPFVTRAVVVPSPAVAKKDAIPPLAPARPFHSVLNVREVHTLNNYQDRPLTEADRALVRETLDLLQKP